MWGTYCHYLVQVAFKDQIIVESIIFQGLIKGR